MTDPTDVGGMDTAAPIFSQSQPDDFAACFDLYEKVDVNHGLFVSRVGAAKTFFHRVEPSKKVSFHSNPVASTVVGKAAEKFHFPVTAKVSGRVSIFTKFKALIRDKFLMRPSCQSRSGNKETTVTSELLQVVSLLLVPKEVVTGATEQELVKKKAKEEMMKPAGWGRDGSNRLWLLPSKGKGIFSMF
ncbi:hypothetical protein ABZP36_006343 [Zizania latifolia]